MEMKDIQAIDTMCRPRYAGVNTEEQIKDTMQVHEMKVMAQTTFGGVVKKMGLKPGEEWKILTRNIKSSVEEMIAEMDEVGVEKVCMDQTLYWSWHDHRFVWDPCPIEKLAELMEKSKGRVIGGAGYNLFRIEESLRDIDRAVKEYGFKYVWFHPMTYGCKPSDKKCYPLYAKCLELGIPVCFQSGHSAEPLPSEVGHPMYADEVAIDFPNLTMVLTHTGWPWIDEWISMLWRHPNVYGCINAYYPSGLRQATVDFMDGGAGRNKVLWGTNGLGLTRCKQEFLELPIRDEAKRKILRDNALKVFKL